LLCPRPDLLCPRDLRRARELCRAGDKLLQFGLPLELLPFALPLGLPPQKLLPQVELLQFGAELLRSGPDVRRPDLRCSDLRCSDLRRTG
jgi:hypothetical protein